MPGGGYIMGKSRKSSVEAKHDILVAARRLFKEHGYGNTTLQMIADELGIAQGTLGYHFSNKYKIANALFKGYIARLYKHIEANMPAGCNTYQYYLTVGFAFWREIMKDESVRDLYFEKDLVAIWDSDYMGEYEKKFRDIAQDFKKELSDEDIHMASVIEIGAVPRIYKEYATSDGAMSVDRFCYYQGYLTGALVNLDEAMIKKNLARVFEILDSMPPFESFSFD